MFSLFRKKASPAYPIESKWNVAAGQHDGHKLFVRRNASAAGLIGHADYVHRVGFAVPLLQSDEEGLPSTEESLVLNDIEDALSDRLEAGQDGLLAVVVTTSGMREFVFYTRKPGTVETIVAEVRQSFPSHKIQFYVAADKNWDGYRQFL